MKAAGSDGWLWGRLLALPTCMQKQTEGGVEAGVSAGKERSRRVDLRFIRRLKGNCILTEPEEAMKRGVGASVQMEIKIENKGLGDATNSEY